MRILAIETSCDDTCISIIKATSEKTPSFKVLSNIVSSQVKIHQKYGGVYPMMAKREHQNNLVPVLKRTLKKAKLLSIKELIPLGSLKSSKVKTLRNILSREEVLYKQLKIFFKKYQKPQVDVIAVTIGPGLEPCLWTGLNFAKALAYYWNLPIVPVNHIEAHILANFISETQSVKRKAQIFPAVCLVVSGGHTQLILMKDFGEYKILGETRDDAAGECFDKTARILGLGYPGGPIIASLASKAGRDPFSTRLPRPMINTRDYDFSFSGLKTAVLYKVKKLKTINYKLKIELCREIQQAIIDVLIKKTIKAAKDYRVKMIILGGGVVANKELRKQFAKKIKKNLPNTQCLIPDTKLCTDNALMVAIAGYFKYRQRKTENWEDIETNANFRLI